MKMKRKAYTLNSNFTQIQLEELETIFSKTPKPQREVKLGLAKKFNIEPLIIYKWFTSRRDKKKRAQHKLQNIKSDITHIPPPPSVSNSVQNSEKLVSNEHRDNDWKLIYNWLDSITSSSSNLIQTVHDCINETKCYGDTTLVKNEESELICSSENLLLDLFPEYNL